MRCATAAAERNINSRSFSLARKEARLRAPLIFRVRSGNGPMRGRSAGRRINFRPVSR